MQKESAHGSADLVTDPGGKENRYYDALEDPRITFEREQKEKEK